MHPAQRLTLKLVIYGRLNRTKTCRSKRRGWCWKRAQCLPVSFEIKEALQKLDFGGIEVQRITVYEIFKLDSVPSKCTPHGPASHLSHILKAMASNLHNSTRIIFFKYSTNRRSNSFGTPRWAPSLIRSVVGLASFNISKAGDMMDGRISPKDGKCSRNTTLS